MNEIVLEKDKYDLHCIADMNSRTYDRSDFNGDTFRNALEQEDNLVRIVFGKNPVVVAAPHHIPEGADIMPCGRPGDENTGYLAGKIAELLKCTMIIAANASYDPNKQEGKYMDALFERKPGIIIETHGHDGTQTENDIEISCGARSFTSLSRRLAESASLYLSELAASLRETEPYIASSLSALKVEGCFDKIYFQARRTTSLRYARERGIIPYHIEHPEHITKGTGREIPPLAAYVTRAVSAAILTIHGTILCERGENLDDLL